MVEVRHGLVGSLPASVFRIPQGSSVAGACNTGQSQSGIFSGVAKFVCSSIALAQDVSSDKFVDGV